MRTASPSAGGPSSCSFSSLASAATRGRGGRIVRRVRRGRPCTRCQRSAGGRDPVVTRDPNFFLDTLRPLLLGRAFRVARGETGPHAARTNVCAQLRARSAGSDCPSAPAARVEQGLAVGCVVPAASERAVPAAPGEKRVILAEHGHHRHVVRRGDYAHDIRLACSATTRTTNDFVIGLLARTCSPSRTSSRR